MNRIIDTIGIVVLFGILIKLSYVFIYLFSELDSGSFVSKITGITFAFSSIYFVIKIEKNWLKMTMIVLDICTILYFYLHNLLNFPIEYSSIIVALYSGFIIFFLGRIVNEKIKAVDESNTNKVRELEEQLRNVLDKQNYETERAKLIRRIKDARSEKTRMEHKKKLEELEEKYR